MKKIFIYTFAVLILAFASVEAQDYNPNISPEHSYLGQFIGEWDQIYQFVPGGKALPSFGRGTAEVKSIMNGVYIEFNSKIKYDIGEVENRLILGYDNTLKKYFMLSYNSTGEKPYTAFGTYDRKANTFTFKGKRSFGNTGEVDLRAEIYWDREDKFIYKVFMDNGVKEVNTITIAYVKK